MRVVSSLTLSALLATAAAPRAWAHSVEQRIGGYEDNQGLTRERVGYDVKVNPANVGSQMSSNSVEAIVLRDRYSISDVAEADVAKRDQYTRQVYGSGERVNDQATLSTTQTWDRLTETRLLGSYATDKTTRSRSIAAGMSEWLFHETLRVGVDISRTVVESPEFLVLDFDSQEVGNPPLVNAHGGTLSVRHLATPTTVVDYSAGLVLPENRPAEKTGAVAVRQFIPPLDGAVHGTVTRSDNRGYVTLDSAYGQVDAWTYEGSWLQNLWRGGIGRLGYRYYREDEITRVYSDKHVFGSDTITVGFTQDLPKRAIDALGVPLKLELIATRYLTNVGVAGRSLEGGVAAKF